MQYMKRQRIILQKHYIVMSIITPRYQRNVYFSFCSVKSLILECRTSCSTFKIRVEPRRVDCLVFS